MAENPSQNHQNDYPLTMADKTRAARIAAEKAMKEQGGDQGMIELAGQAGAIMAAKKTREEIKAMAKRTVASAPIAESGMLSAEHARDMKRKIGNWLESKDAESGLSNQRLLLNRLNENFGVNGKISEGDFIDFLNELKTPAIINKGDSIILNNWIARQEEKGEVLFPTSPESFIKELKKEIGLN